MITYFIFGTIGLLVVITGVVYYCSMSDINGKIFGYGESEIDFIQKSEIELRTEMDKEIQKK